jgi:hypothetical protein
MTITREKYHDFWGVSNSSLSYALPECGGSYKKFTAFMAGEIGKEETPEMKLGSLLHKYLESPRSFTVTVIENMPSDTLKAIIGELKPDTRPELKDYAKDVIAIARARNYNKNWGDEAIAKKILTDGSEYFKALIAGEEITDKETATKLNGISEVFRREHSSIIDDAEFKTLAGPDWEVQKEIPFSWSEDDITFKMLIDRLEINHKLKQINFYDYKTTSTPMSFYAGYSGYEIEGDKPAEMKVVPRFNHGTLIRYHVHRQVRFYKRGLSVLFPDYEIKGFVLAIEVNPPYETKLIDFSKIKVYEEYGDMLIERALAKVKEFFEKEISI